MYHVAVACGQQHFGLAPLEIYGIITSFLSKLLPPFLCLIYDENMIEIRIWDSVIMIEFMIDLRK
jgi:hypothetical protein